MTESQKTFITRIKPGAVSAQSKYGVLASLTLAQSILESGWGKSAIGNNLFGIKATESWTGKKQLVDTMEYYNGVKTAVKAWFRDYDSIDASIEDHAKLLTMARYKPVIASNGYQEACRQVKACGYATDPMYAAKLIGMIDQYGLNAWDSRPVKEPANTVSAECIAILKAVTSASDRWVAYIKGQTGYLAWLDELIVKVYAVRKRDGVDWKTVIKRTSATFATWYVEIDKAVATGRNPAIYIPALIEKLNNAA